MSKNNLLSSAYALYADELHIINMIIDNDCISVTEFAELLCKILNTNNISAKLIIKLLLDKHCIIKQSKEQLDKMKKLNLKPSKYIPTECFATYCKKVYCKDFSFYLWKFDMVLPLFNINFEDQLTIDSAKLLCKIMSKYAFAKFNTNIVFLNLVKLQLILEYERRY